MALDGLQFDLRSAISRAKERKPPGTEAKVCSLKKRRRQRSATETTRFVNFEVIPLAGGNLKEHYFMVVFEESRQEGAGAAGIEEEW